MTHSVSHRWRIALFLFIALMASFACLPSGPATDVPPPQAVTAQGEMILGSGSFNLADTRAGLSELASYKATLTLAFDGTHDGQPSQWSRTYVMVTTKEPAAREFSLERAGNLTDLERVFMAEADGAAYERRGEEACNANIIEAGNTLAERMEPAGLLMGVIGADEAGNETVNGTATNHITFDERALGQSGLSDSTGEMWVAVEGGYIVRYMLTSQGGADYFGEGIEGTLTWNYELTDVNQPLTIELPADCPAGMVNAPLLPDASNVLNAPSVLSYDTSSSLTEAAAFYREQIPNLGWESIAEPAITETTALMEFTQGDQLMTVIIIAGETDTNVKVLLSKP